MSDLFAKIEEFNKGKSELVKELFAKEKALLADLKAVQTALKEFSGAVINTALPIATEKSAVTKTKAAKKTGKRVNATDTLITIVANAGKGGISQADILKSKELVALYGGKVSPQANKLATMVKLKALKRTGTGKATKFHLPS